MRVTDAPPRPEDRVGEVTALLSEVAAGDASAEALVERLMPIVYDELRDIARAQRRRYDVDGFQTTALVHEAYLRMAGQSLVPDRAYVFASAARAMRNVLVDHARRRHAAKRGGDARPVGLTTAGAIPDTADLDRLTSRLLDVDHALDGLAALDARAAQVVECRYFGGLSFEETAAALGVSVATAKRDWRRARAWLHRSLGDDADADAA
ncbi:ECF-type sigma factor [Rubrivirga sp. IMCC45206]|uniref:ECF-type sigma factor n=1 Tax=Rubrivirga sp. IMCC45206 TaxID=3391614 RepID=UPI00398FF2F4